MKRADLPASLRKVLERAIREARIAAEAGASDAIRRLAVAAASPPSHLDKVAKDLRVRLRAHARSVGDTRRSDDTHEVGQLTEEVAYAHWHRLLFARFLLERRLLREPASGGEVSLDDCRELARAHGLPDAWSVAERFAASMLPGVFRPDDPALALALAPEHAASLQRIVQSIEPAIFQADDSLGWTYQFWRAAEKDEINNSGAKIGARELPAVTQLFTEPYMVRFLLHNTIGAWWASKVLASDPISKSAVDETMLRNACALPGIDWEYLRFVRENGEWHPAAGAFSKWPQEAKAITVLDPCCGSGHFLVEAFAILTALRAEEESLVPAAAVTAVLKDNLFGLELDGRCVQLASFAIALAAWRLGESTAALPNPHIAWVGAPPPLPRKDFVALANGDKELGQALEALHDLFVEAPLLGSLLRPTGSDLVDPLRIARIETQLDPVVARLRATEPERAEGAIAARGMADAAELLARRYVLQATNVPYLGRGKQEPALAGHIARSFPDAKADLAVAMLSRMLDLAVVDGTLAAVTPQNWLFLGSYQKFRRRILTSYSIDLLVTLGEEAWEAFGMRGPMATLIILDNTVPSASVSHLVIDATDTPDRLEKIKRCAVSDLRSISQAEQRANPDMRIATAKAISGELLSAYADYGKGSTTGDGPRYILSFWELNCEARKYQRWLNSPNGAGDYWGGRSNFLVCSIDDKELSQQLGCRIHGQINWGKRGLAINKMRNIFAFYYDGEIFDDNVATVVARNDNDALPVEAFLRSEEYAAAVRKIDPKVSVTAATLTKVVFEAERWRRVAADKYPNGLPEPYSDDPTQWLFHGHPKKAERGLALHVALARLAGYRWPAENDPKMFLAVDARAWIGEAAKLGAVSSDGLLCLPAVAGERTLVDRLRSFLTTAFGSDWSDATERRLLAETDERFENKPSRDLTLESWLRDRFFSQHCTLFGHRPFLWHIWDRQKDGFGAIVQYQRLNRAIFEKLTFSLIGDWIERMKAAGDGRRIEAATILQQRLQAILEGEKPYDVFVRWKPLAKQPLGWDPDLDDGVRMNIRPFVEAEVLREVPNVKWTKDRGTDVKNAPWYDVFKGQRFNDHHTTLAEKRRARGLK